MKWDIMTTYRGYTHSETGQRATPFVCNTKKEGAANMAFTNSEYKM